MAYLDELSGLGESEVVDGVGRADERSSEESDRNESGVHCCVGGGWGSSQQGQGKGAI